MAISTNGTVLTRLAGALYDTQLSNATYDEVKASDPAALANALYARDFGTTTDLAVAKILLANLGLSSFVGVDVFVAGQLTAAGTGAKGAKIVDLLNGFAQMTSDATFGAAATEFNEKVQTALTMSQTEGNSGGTFADVGETSSQTTFTLTSGLNTIRTVAGNEVYGDEDTLTSGDNIIGAGDVELDLTSATISGQDIDGAASITIESTGGSTVRASDWINIGALIINNSTGSVTVNDQQALTDTLINDVVDAAATITLNYDSQVVSGTANDLELAVSEVTATIAVSGGNVEELTLTIADVTGAVSTLADLTVAGISTLEINGGTAGLAFGITGALDAGLDTISAGDAASNMSLNVNASTEDMVITLGTGNDTLITGDTLGDADEQDTIVGGAGTDTVTAVLATAGTRNPIMTEVETMTLTFSDSATVDFTEVDDLATINVLASTVRAQLIDMDDTVATLNVTGAQAGIWDIDFENAEDAGLTVNWTNSSGAADAITSIEFDEVQDLTINSKGDDNLDLVATTVDAADTETITISVQNNGDLDTGALIDTDVVSSLSLETTTVGDLVVDTMDDAQSLETLTIEASTSGTIDLSAIGSSNAAEALELVNITTEGADITVGLLDAEDATVSEFNITAGADSTVTIGDGSDSVIAQDISEMTVTIEQDSTVDFDGTITLTVHGETLTVSGEGTLDTLTFADESFARMNFGGLTVAGVTVVHDNDSAGAISFTGTALADTVTGGAGRLTAEFGAGADTVDMATSDGALTADMGAGIDNVTLNDAGADADVVQMGGTSVATSAIAAATDDAGLEALADTINGFDSNDDAVAFTSTSAAGTADNYDEADGAAVTTFGDAKILADAALDGTVAYYMLYDFNDSENGILFYDSTGDGSSDLVIYLVGVDVAGAFDQGDIAVGADIIA
jgi:hypothetical protein